MLVILMDIKLPYIDFILVNLLFYFIRGGSSALPKYAKKTLMIFDKWDCQKFYTRNGQYSTNIFRHPSLNESNPY